MTEGSKTGVKSIEFIGNAAYSSYRLKDVIKTRESNLLSFLGGGDVYDPDRVEADRDLIRRYYLKNGYADVQVVAALTEYDPERNGFLVTFKIEEGQQYRVGRCQFRSPASRTLDGNTLRRFSRVNVGSLYNAEALEKSVEEMQIEASRRGYAFAIVRPRGDRNFEAHTVSIIFAIDEGPRTYIERINVRGNTRTREYVIRREFDLSEGDAYNRALVDRAERRLKNLDFFKSVKITTEPGSSSDRVDSRGRSRGEIDRRLLGVGRLFDDRWRAGRSQHLRAQLPRPRSVRQGVGANMASTRAVTRCRSSSPICWTIASRSGSTCSSANNSPTLYFLRHQTIGFSPRLGFSLREDLSLQLRYSIYQQKISLPDHAARIVTTINSADGVTPIRVQSKPGFRTRPAA